MSVSAGFAILALIISNTTAGEASSATDRPRVIVSTDIGGSDPDDFQSMVHYLVYADRFDTEGLISSPPDKGRAEHILEAIAAYEKDFENLRTWSEDYPAPDALRAVVRQGAIDPQAGEAPEALSEGAALIVDRALADDPRPLYVLVWGSGTDVAQAVHAKPEIKKNIRIYYIGSWNTSMDRKSRDYLFNQHPDLWWIESDTTFRGMYMGGNQVGEWDNVKFPELHVAGHGALGALFMAQKTDIKMGDTPSVLYMLHGDPSTPETEHWGGAFVRPDPAGRPTYWHDSPDPALQYKDKPGAITVNKRREAYLEDWKQRMDRARAKKTTPEGP